MHSKVDWKEQSEKFDKASEYYDLYRPGYPTEMISLLVEKSKLNDDSHLLDIGAGSGKATKLFSGYVKNVSCVEPGKMLAQKGLTYLSDDFQVKYYVGRFEEWHEDELQFDLIISAQAFHWVPQPIGFEKCSHLLKDDGSIGLFWNYYKDTNEPIDHELLELSSSYGNVKLFHLDSEERIQERVDETLMAIKKSGLFTDITAFRFPWKKEYTAEEYLGFIKTGNGYLSLNGVEMQSVEEDFIQIIDAHGGTITRHYECVLYYAENK